MNKKCFKASMLMIFLLLIIIPINVNATELNIEVIEKYISEFNKQ